MKSKLFYWLNARKKKESHLINCQLFPVDESSYGAKYKDHFFDQYKLYIELTDRVSQRRISSNTFFLTANTALLSVMGFVIPFLSYEKSDWNILFTFAGIFLCMSWIITIKTHKQLNQGRFKVINEIEERLPINLFNYEWHCLGQGKDRKKYLQLSRVERFVPVLFIIIYVIAGLFLLYEKLNIENSKHNIFDSLSI